MKMIVIVIAQHEDLARIPFCHPEDCANIADLRKTVIFSSIAGIPHDRKTVESIQN